MKKPGIAIAYKIASTILLNIIALSIIIFGWFNYAADVDIDIIQWTVWLGVLLLLNLVLSCNLYSPIILKIIYAVLLINIIMSYLQFIDYTLMVLHQWSILYAVLWSLPALATLIILTIFNFKGRKTDLNSVKKVVGFIFGKNDWSRYFSHLGTMWIDVAICAIVMITTVLSYPNKVVYIILYVVSTCVLCIRLIHNFKSAFHIKRV